MSLRQYLALAAAGLVLTYIFVPPLLRRDPDLDFTIHMGQAPAEDDAEVVFALAAFLNRNEVGIGYG